MSEGPDIQKALQQDVDRFNRLNQTSIRGLSPGVVLEGIMWSCALISVIAMIVSMPWVGDGKMIPSYVWLGYSLLGIVFCSGLAVALRKVRGIGGDLGAGKRNRIAGSRGR